MPAAHTVNEILRRTGGRLEGHFVFTSGLHAPEYVNVRVLRKPKNKRDLDTVALLMAYATRSCDPQCVVVPASADQWLGPAVSAALEQLVYHKVPCVGAAKVRDDSGRVTALSIADDDIEKVRFKRVLVIDDDEDIVALIYGQLESQGYVLDSAGTGELGLQLALDNEYDLIILDWMLPGISGLEVCRDLRDRSERYTPILMLTARGAVEHKIEGFAAGADDYLAKPFSILELDARVKALGRRGRSGDSRHLEVEDLTLDLSTMEIRRQGKRIELAPIHVRILTLLMQRAPEVVSRASLESVIWGDEPPDSDALRVHIYTLRNAIDRPFDVPLLHTIPKMGYRLAKIED